VFALLYAWIREPGFLVFCNAILACLLAQAFKILIEYWRTKKVNLSMMVSTGGMPSSHSALMAAMSASVGFAEGFWTSAFAVSAIIAMVVMYDAAGVRRAAGKQAEVINMLVASLENQGIKLDRKLKELLGHSPVEVASGALLGVSVAAVICNIAR